VYEDRRQFAGVSVRWFAGIAFGILAAASAYVCIPRHADLTSFAPDSVGRSEMLMWRHVDERRYFALFRDLYDFARRQYGFSPLDSLRFAVAIAGAARSFQASASPSGTDAALPWLVAYFRILASAAKIPFAVEDAARTELAWWQARHNAVPPEQYGLMIARVASIVYGVDGEDLRRSGVLRAQAMAYRDAHQGNMSSDDWRSVAAQLELAYVLLKKSLPPQPPQPP
jgi:hypothetical protein